MKVVVLPNVELDILEHAVWWARHHSSEQAWRWIVTVESQVQAIGQQPESHRALFTIMNDTVYVLTVVRSSQDLVDVSKLPRFPF